MNFKQLCRLAAFTIFLIYVTLTGSMAFFFSGDRFWEVLWSERMVFSIQLSLAVATVAMLLAMLLAIPTAYALSRHDFWGKTVIDTVLELPMIVSPAAIGAMPLAEVFYSMTAKGYRLGEILREMNAKLKRILPTDMFCCATLACVSALRRSVEVWNGGMPDGYLLSLTGHDTILTSQHLPLGVLPAQRFDHGTQVWPMLPGDQLFLLTDGVIETSGPDDQLFGVERLQRVIAHNRDPQQLITEVEQALRDFQGSSRDDISMVHITSQLPQKLGAPAMLYSDSGQCSPLDWSASFEFRAVSLQQFNPLPYLLHLLMEVHGLRPQGAVIHAVLSELYSNALEHGVLGLDSSLKRDPQGFTKYYELRQERLATLKDGYVRVKLHVIPLREGGRAVVCVEDSGAGFDVASILARPLDRDRLSGRGVSLIRHMCPQVRWSDDGRSATVEFSWEAEA